MKPESHVRLSTLLPIAVGGAILTAVAAWRRLQRRSLLPETSALALPGLTEEVVVRRDLWGVPHIYARNEHDLFFAQGYIHAQDRLFQMDTHRRLGAGRISEIVGPGGLEADRVARYFGWPRAAQAVVDGADEGVRAVMAAYAGGVNAFIGHRPLPPEFALLHYAPEPWGLPDTAAWSVVLAWGLSGNLETELLRLALLETVGPHRASDLTPFAVDDYVAVLDGKGVDARFALALVNALHDASAYLPSVAVPGSRALGSNNWVVSADRSATGRPVLANDPHLPPTYPPLWYENHLEGGDFHVTGFTMPGVPGVIVGHNQHVAWGVTNAFPDIQDVYLERFDPEDPTRYEVNGRWQTVDLVPETIHVRGRADVIETVRYTRHGPVFSDLLPAVGHDLALKWMSMSPGNHLRAVLGMNRAKDWPSFRAALRSWSFPSQNVVFAGTDGDIAYMMPGRVPKRRRGDGLLPAPGWNDLYAWEGWIPFTELPRQLNPAAGTIVTANNRVHGSDYPHLLTGEWLPDYRARRIAQLLRVQHPIPFAHHARIQQDVVSLQAQRFLAPALAALEQMTPAVEPELADAISVLAGWDGDMQGCAVAATLYTGWLHHFTQAAIRMALGPELAEQFLKPSPPALLLLDSFLEMAPDLSLQWLEGLAPDWVGDVRPLLLPALRRTLRVLEQEVGTKQEEWRWGQLHRISLHHPLTRLPLAGRPWRLDSLAAPGDGYTVNQAQHPFQFPPGPVEVIASCRLIIDVGAWDNSLAALPGGQAGQPASVHYADGLDDWQHGRYHPMLFSEKRVLAATNSTIHLQPARVHNERQT